MKLQFSIKTIFLATAAVAITCVGVLGYISIWGTIFTAGYMPRYIFRYTSPLYVPIAYGGYALGRKKLTVPMVISFAVIEAVSLAILYFVVQADSRVTP